MDDDSATRRRKRNSGIAQAYRDSHEVMSAAIGIAVLSGVGYWLDSKLGWKPLLTICGLLLGIISAGLSIHRLLARLDRESRRDSTSMKARDE
ncbi:MAG: AtpZ/AtpI family protein [Fuerstiella sp.]|nr:AtpZ/AtpI family protein [Fuerstiella sp.]